MENTKGTNNPLFKTHLLNEKGIEVAKEQGHLFSGLYNNLHHVTFNGRDGDTPNWEGREWALVKTKLEEAAFYAKKAMATQPEYQKQ